MKIALACDHGGLELKQAVISYLKASNIETIDFGTNSLESCDYPDFAYKAALSVKNNEADLGIVLCTTGIGVSIVCNKVKGIRAALVTDVRQAKLTKEHNNPNVLALGSLVTQTTEALKIVEVFINTPFEGGRHSRRVDKITKIEVLENE